MGRCGDTPGFHMQYPSLSACQADCRKGGGGEEPGCMDPTALNYNQCCNQDPNCTPTIPDEQCCEYERGGCNIMIGPNDPDWPFCMECFNAPPGPNPSVTGNNCECCKEEDPCPPPAGGCGYNQFWTGPPKCKCECDLYLECEPPSVFNPKTCKCGPPLDEPYEDGVWAGPPIDEQLQRMQKLANISKK
jgi:hypothetical protein